MRRSREDYDNAALYIQDRIRGRRLRIRAVVLLVILAAAGGLIFLLSFFRVRFVTVEGSSHYTDEQIRQYATEGILGDNTLAISLRSGTRKFSDIPFIETMDIEVLSRDAIHVTVYEKSLAGYVTYLGRYMYFDRNGMVVESSAEKLDGIPEVTGLTFSYIALNEKLPVEDESIFTRILQTTQLLSKHALSADRLYVGQGGKITAYFGEVVVRLGEDEYMDEKLSNLAGILPSLEGRSGTVDLSEYTPDTDFITFTER